MNALTNGEILRIVGVPDASENELDEAYRIVKEVQESAGEILSREELIQSAEDIYQERRKGRGQRELDLDSRELHEPFSNVWLNELRAQTGHWEDAR